MRKRFSASLRESESSASAFCCETRAQIAADVIEAVQHAHELQRIEFFRLDQHFLAHANFAEVVEERGVAYLLHLFTEKRKSP